MGLQRIVGVGLLCLVACAGGSATTGTRLVNTSAVTGHCRYGGTAADWSTLQHSSTEEALDYFTLRSPSDDLTITHVALYGISGSLVLDHAAFVPGQAVGDGAPWGFPHDMAYVPGWSTHIDLPISARQQPVVITKTSAVRRLELVVGVEPGASGGYALGARVSYQIGTYAGVITGHDFLGEFRDDSQCDVLDRKI